MSPRTKQSDLLAVLKEFHLTRLMDVYHFRHLSNNPNLNVAELYEKIYGKTMYKTQREKFVYSLRKLSCDSNYKVGKHQLLHLISMEKISYAGRGLHGGHRYEMELTNKGKDLAKKLAFFNDLDNFIFLCLKNGIHDVKNLNDFMKLAKGHDYTLHEIVNNDGDEDASVAHYNHLLYTLRELGPGHSATRQKGYKLFKIEELPKSWNEKYSNWIVRLTLKGQSLVEAYKFAEGGKVVKMPAKKQGNG